MSGLDWLRPAAERRAVVQQAAVRESRVSAGRLREAAAAASASLLALQRGGGYWCAELTADTTLESDYILFQLWMHPPDGPTWNPPARARVDKACRAILDRQLPEGGWAVYPGGPAELNASIRAYAVLRIAGHDAGRPEIQRARDRVVALGGLHAANSYTKINLSLFGLYPKSAVPTVPPEIVILPGNVLYEMSSWTRTILVPLSVVQAIGKSRPAPEGLSLDELIAPGTRAAHPIRGKLTPIFVQIDRALKVWERWGIRDVRALALREAEQWMLDRTRYTDGLGAIFPSMMYFIMALDSLGYPEDHPDLLDGIRQFEDLLIETEDRFQYQPCVSPLWDTAYAAFALGEAGQAPREALRRAGDWMISREVRRRGDWSIKRPDLEPSGWAFEYANEYYPDIDDTAMVLLALRHTGASDPERLARCERRAVNWLIGMQSRDGGWAAFDVDNDWHLLNQVPFADHNAMLDPTCPDITGRVLEALTACGIPSDHPAVQGGIRFLLNSQEANGSWYGRWGVNYVYGTFLALRGLAATGDPAALPAITRAAGWLRSVQNPDGGWGESCASYDVDRFVPAPSTASQTAWGLLGLAAAGDRSSPAVERGVEWLLERQRPDGTWEETQATGTGFPRVFYLVYHLYRHYFPLLALATCARAVDRPRLPAELLNGHSHTG